MNAKRMAHPISLVLFDAFDTLVTPRIPPYLQYSEEARKAGLHVDDAKVKDAFKKSFKELANAYPVYGLNTGLASSDEWWTQLIERVMLHADVPQESLSAAMPKLGPALLRRFESAEAYTLAEGVPDFLAALSQSNKLTLSMATNSDARILRACKDLGLAAYLDLDVRYDKERSPTNVVRDAQQQEESVCTGQHQRRVPISGPTLSYDVGFEKPDKRFFYAAVQRAFPKEQQSKIAIDGSSSLLEQMCRQTLYVGDHLTEDFLGAKRAGLQAIWLKRSQPWPSDKDGNEARSTVGENEYVSSGLDLPELIWRRFGMA